MISNQSDILARIQGSGYDEPGYAAHYDAARPPLPIEGIQVLYNYAQLDHPRLVVDLGAGTGLSTRPWAAYAPAGKRAARAVIGIEPNLAMIDQARVHPETPPHVTYREAFGHDTGLEDASADVVVCHQALHWMEPEPTLAEVARLLPSGSAFAAFRYPVMPALLDWRADRALQAFERDSKALRALPGAPPTPYNARPRWDPDRHKQRLVESGHFQHVRELRFHHQSWGAVDDLAAYCLSIGGIHYLLTAGRPEIGALFERLEREIRRTAGEEAFPWLWSYRLWIGIRA
jgi:SAM-dependent methyltransferase